MSSKKNPTRFNIKFDPDNPKHQKVVEILNQKKRGAAEFIAEAITSYEANSTNIEETITRIVKQVLEIQQNVLIPTAPPIASEKLADFDFDEIAEDLANFKSE